MPCIIATHETTNSQRLHLIARTYINRVALLLFIQNRLIVSFADVLANIFKCLHRVFMFASNILERRGGVRLLLLLFVANSIIISYNNNLISDNELITMSANMSAYAPKTLT